MISHFLKIYILIFVLVSFCYTCLYPFKPIQNHL